MSIAHEFTVGQVITSRSSRHDGVIFLAGPIERVAAGHAAELPKWRSEALGLLRQHVSRFVVLNPEWTQQPTGWTFEKQVAWEITAMRWADAILCWIPRSLPLLPGFTTNIEVGEWLHSDKLLLGAPPGTPACQYLETRWTWLHRTWFTDLTALTHAAADRATAEHQSPEK